MTTAIVLVVYIAIAWRGLPALAKLEFEQGPEADLHRLAERGPTYGSWGTMRSAPLMNMVFMLLLLPGYGIAKAVEAGVRVFQGRRERTGKARKPTATGPP